MERTRFAAMLGVPETKTPEGRHRLSRSHVATNPHIRWNAFIDIISALPKTHPEGAKKQASLVFLYESLVQNGGHDSYFHCDELDAEVIEQTVFALTSFGDHCRAKVLARAHRFVSQHESVDTTAFDGEFHKCEPTLISVLEKHLNENESLYIEWA